MDGFALDAVLRRDRLIVGAALFVVAALAWGYLVVQAPSMSGPDAGMAMPGMEMAAPAGIGVLFAMWFVMMIAMMLPSATPMLLMFAAVNRRRRERQAPVVPIAVFLAGYLIVWGLYSAVVAVAQSLLHDRAMLSPAMAATSPLLSGAILVLAGVFQWTPLKAACLTACRSPLAFVMTGWRDGVRGALVMGVRHGGYCLACCWVLMLLLFVAGVMNLAWVALIAAFVLVEKVSPGGPWVGRVAGAVLAVWGLALLVPLR